MVHSKDISDAREYSTRRHLCHCRFAEYDGKAEKETEMTSSADERDKRSVGDHVQMTAEHMVPGGEDAKVNRAVRLKRDLTSRRWIDAGKT